MTRLGVARTLPWRRESTKRLTRELTALLNDRRYRHTVATGLFSLHERVTLAIYAAM
jgi:hypothetical protein